MDRGLLPMIVDASTHGGKSLCLQLSEQHLLTDTISLQTLTVYI